MAPWANPGDPSRANHQVFISQAAIEAVVIKVLDNFAYGLKGEMLSQPTNAPGSLISERLFRIATAE